MSKNSYKSRGITFLVISVILCGLGINSAIWFYQDQNAMNWPNVSGQVKEFQDCIPVLQCGVLYAYSVNGVKHEGTKASFSNAHLPKGWNDDEEANWLKQQFKVNEKVKVFYEPSNPKNAVLFVGLLPKSYAGDLAAPLVLALLFFVAGIIQIMKHNKANQH